MQRRWMLRAFAAATLLGVFAIVGAGCQSIAGIQDRKLQPFSQQCIDYCDTVQNNCFDDHLVYPDKDTCLKVCAALPPGSPGDTSNSNTVACRMRSAVSAKNSQSEACPAAGPGGAGTCGSDCDGYCTLFEAICPKEFSVVQDCTDKCRAIADDKGFSAQQQTGDTVQCRLAQLELATKDKSACVHAAFLPSGKVCQHLSGTPDCEDYCRAVMVACTGDIAQYHDTKTHTAAEECQAVCSILAQQHPGKWDDFSGQSIGCRYNHSFFALGAPTTHCPHAGPGGDGTCSDKATANCESYCILFQGGCPTEFSTRYQGVVQNCLDDCAQIKGAGTNKLYDTDSDGNRIPTPMVCYLQSLDAAIVDQSAAECQAVGNGC